MTRIGVDCVLGFAQLTVIEVVFELTGKTDSDSVASEVVANVQR
jgi:hypothetical protein